MRAHEHATHSCEVGGVFEVPLESLQDQREQATLPNDELIGHSNKFRIGSHSTWRTI